MKCPVCRSDQIIKNGRRGAKQSYRCKECGRQFVESYASRGYSRDAKQICLNLYRSGMGFRAIERATGISHNTVINWVRQEEPVSVDVAEPTETTELEELNQLSADDRLESQRSKIWLHHSRRKALVNKMSLLHLVA
ncbi:MAG: hypothetical protein KME27_16810 [Lyngbya sp. HA4199-MV5]|nr:hypothetical protein [Lyngbya sp. HA4199-MV5]